MKYKLKEYLEAEIPDINEKKGIMRLISFIKLMRYSPSCNAIFLLRYCYVYQEAKGIRKFLRIHYNRILINRYGIYFNIDKNGIIGKGLFLPHPTSIIFGNGINIGENCTVYQNVTLGAKKHVGKDGPYDTASIKYPQIGDGCVFYAGAVVVGGIHVSDGTQVGANSVLLTDTEENSVYAGAPATRKK